MGVGVDDGIRRRWLALPFGYLEWPPRLRGMHAMITARRYIGSPYWLIPLLTAILLAHRAAGQQDPDARPEAPVVIYPTSYEQARPAAVGTPEPSEAMHGAVRPIPIPTRPPTNRACVPNSRYFGYYQPIWRTWPCEPRPDKAIPQAVGAEPVPRPTGTPQPPLPVEKFERLEELPLPEATLPTEPSPKASAPRAPLPPPTSGDVPRALPTVPQGGESVPPVGSTLKSTP